jgi:PadR family transcriptional regulator, regulatory protein AphA
LTRNFKNVYIHNVNIQLKTKIPAESPRNPAEYAVLGALERNPAHGYDLYHYLSTSVGAIWNLKISQVYALLGRLENEGLVSHQRLAQEKRPDRKIFTLTDEGEKVFKEWVGQPVRHVRGLRLEFLSKLHFARDMGRGTATRLIKAQMAVLEEKYQGMRQKAKSTETFMETQALRYRLLQTKAALAWLQELMEAEKKLANVKSIKKTEVEGMRSEAKGFKEA